MKHRCFIKIQPLSNTPSDTYRIEEQRYRLEVDKCQHEVMQFEHTLPVKKLRSSCVLMCMYSQYSCNGNRS